MHHLWSKGDYEISTDPARIDISMVHQFLTNSYWAYLADVFISPAYRGRGLSQWLMECIVSHPDLQGLRRWVLATQDAHGLYAKFGFTPIKHPDSWMEIHRPDVYTKAR